LTSQVCSDGSPVTNIDLSAGESVTCTFTNVKQARITVDKVTNPSGDTQSFTFTPTAFNGGATFGLADQTAPFVSGFLAPGTGYAVAETTIAGWALTSSTCTDGSPVTNINLSAGESVTCTFTNVKQARLLVDKVTNPSGDTQQFTFTATNWNSNGTFQLADQTALKDSGFLAPGTGYAVAESVPVGWQQTTATCSDGSPTTNINLSPGEVVTCTFNNLKLSRIVVDKVTVPSGNTTQFTFTPANWNGNATFQLADATAPKDSGFVITPGTGYAVSEATLAGWQQTSATCSDGSPVTNVNLSPGESVTCTFINSKLPQIIVRKVTTGGAGGPFGFTTTGGNGFTGPFNISTVTPGVPVAAPTFNITAIGGNYTVTEATQAPGFAYTDVGCENTVAGVPAATFAKNDATRTMQINGLGAGSVVTCTFINSGSFTTRTQGFWSTHYSLLVKVWSPTPQVVGGLQLNGMTDAERSLCGTILTPEQVAGGFWVNIAKMTTGDHRSDLDKFRMQLLQQLLAAILNNQTFGSVPNGSISIDQAKAAFCGTDIDAIKDAQQAMGAFNEAGDSGLFTPGASANPKTAKAVADLDFWDGGAPLSRSINVALVDADQLHTFTYTGLGAAFQLDTKASTAAIPSNLTRTGLAAGPFAIQQDTGAPAGSTLTILSCTATADSSGVSGVISLATRTATIGFGTGYGFVTCTYTNAP
jgi:hypothetical protein